MLVELGRYNEAIDAYEAEIKISTNGTTSESLSPLKNIGRDHAVFLYQLVGDLLFSSHRTRVAIAHYEKALTIGGDAPSFHYYLLALAHYQLGEYERHEFHLEALQVGC